MKKRYSIFHHDFWKRCFYLWLVCWVAYCAGEFLLLMLVYRETMPHLRDYSILGWTQHTVFAAAYYLIFTRPACRLAPPQAEDSFRPLRAVGGFFRRDWRQAFLLLGCAVLYELLQAVYPDSNDLFSALLVVPFPSASVIHTPVIRTLIAVSLSLVSMLLPHVLLLYREQKAGTRRKM